MSETKHTPGLLVVVEKGMWEVEVQAQSGGTTCVLTNDNDWFPNEEGGARGRSHKTLMADAHLYAAAPDLLAALDAYHRWMTSNFDELAEEFRKATGMMAPGKDQPPGYFDGADETGRKDAWSRWISERKSNLNAAAVAALAKAKGEA